MVFIARQGTLVAGHPHVTPFYTRMYRLPTPGCKGWQHGGVYGIICLFLLKKRGLLWNEEPYFANLIPIIFVFTFVYSIILYAFSKVTESNMLVSNHMIKCPVLGVIEAVIQDVFFYHSSITSEACRFYHTIENQHIVFYYF